jgi:hypothetical protein
MSTPALDLALNNLRFRVYERLFAKQGIVVNRKWLRKKIFSGASQDAILRVLDDEVARLSTDNPLAYWTYRGIRRFGGENAVLSVDRNQ